MPAILRLFFQPPLAIGRLGSSDTPLENFVWVRDPTVHGAARTVIEPAPTIQVDADGSARVYLPSTIRLRDDDALRPVCPFFELWASVQFNATDTALGIPGTAADMPLTRTLLEAAGGSLEGIEVNVTVGNRKAARRSGNVENMFEAQLKLFASDFRRHELLAITPPKPQQEALVTPDHPIHLGHFQVLRPVANQRSHGIDLDVIRMRFTPARGEVYGPPQAIEGQDANTGRFFQIVPPAHRILNPKASWCRYDASPDKYNNPQPWDTYDGADQDENIAWGVVDDTCDGTIEATAVIGHRRFSANSRTAVSPPDFAPDRRPFYSLADMLADRDEPVPDVSEHPEEVRQSVVDLFQRVFETAGMINLDKIRAQNTGQENPLLLGDRYHERVEALPYNDERSMTWLDNPQRAGHIEVRYASEKVRDLIRPQIEAATAATADPLPYTDVVQLAHGKLAEEDALDDFLRTWADRVRHLIRPPYGRFFELRDQAPPDSEPAAYHRDPRIRRDQAGDMRMPPYMRSADGTALSLSWRQYQTLMQYVEYLLEHVPPPPASAHSEERTSGGDE